MPKPLIVRAEVDAPQPHPRQGGVPHVAVVVSLNFPGLTEDAAALMRRFTRNALTAVAGVGASYSLVDSSDAHDLAAAVSAGATADALVVLGGGDISPGCYGGAPDPAPNSYGMDEAADRASITLIRAYAEVGRPVLGICRGSQLINVAYGGTILADIADYRLHRGGPGEPTFLDEEIEVLEGTRLASVLGTGPITVRSGHHQAVDRVGPGLVVAAAALDGIVEAIEHRTDWVLGVQFHPEDDHGSSRELSLLLAALLDEVRRTGETHPPIKETLPMSLPEQKRILATEIPGPRSVELHRQRDSAFAAGFGTVLPVFVDRAGGGIIVDVDGNHLIDLASGIAVTSVGASHPEVVARIQEQAQKFTHTCFMVTEYESAVQVAETLNRITPGDHEKRTGLYTTGAEAVENAVKIARTHTGRSAVVALSHAYHGRTLLTMTMTAKNVPYKDGFGPFAPEVYRVPSPYSYRWTGAATDEAGIAQEAFDELVETITTQIGVHNVAAIIAEPIQGEGGFIVPPAGYLAKVAAYAREHGIVFIADEIQAGLGRTGAMFAVDHEGVVPDLITTAKALAGGMPLSAVTGRADIMDSVAPGGLGGTYAGNPIACVAALASLEVIERDDLAAKARRIEEIVKPRLQALTGPDSWVGEVRGRGAMLAMEFVQPGSKQPAPDAAKQVAAYANNKGVVTLTCGTYGNVIRLLPPLVIEEHLLDDALSVLEEAVESLA